LSASATSRHDPLGILGGTFDPVHNAHVRLAECALAALGLAAIRWVPSGLPGHRDSPQAGVEDRLAMLRLAIADEPRYRIDEFELRSEQPTYTVQTLARLRAELGTSVPFVFLIGADQLLALDRWKEWTSLFELAHFGVARRPGYPVSAASLPPAVGREYERRLAAPEQLARRPAGLIVPFDMTPLDISASAIREALADGRKPAGVLPERVLEYVLRRGIYTQPAESKGKPSPA
jgi:nicotinate-nucleotide adenylyltransferase